MKFRNGALFACSGCGAETQPVQDIADYDQVWRHLNFAEYPIYFHAEHPRTNEPGTETIVMCNHGDIVAPEAQMLLVQRGFEKVRVLKGGVDGFIRSTEKK